MIHSLAVPWRSGKIYWDSCMGLIFHKYLSLDQHSTDWLIKYYFSFITLSIWYNINLRTDKLHLQETVIHWSKISRILSPPRIKSHKSWRSSFPSKVLCKISGLKIVYLALVYLVFLIWSKLEGTVHYSRRKRIKGKKKKKDKQRGEQIKQLSWDFFDNSFWTMDRSNSKSKIGSKQFIVSEDLSALWFL